jgi:hypothetical protein
MKKLYTINGIKNEGDMVRLVLDSNNFVTQKKGLLNNLGNLSELQQQMTVETQRKQNPDTIRIPFDFWEKHQWNIGDVISVIVEE